MRSLATLYLANRTFYRKFILGSLCCYCLAMTQRNLFDFSFQAVPAYRLSLSSLQGLVGLYPAG